MKIWKRLLMLCLTLALLSSALPVMAAEAELTYEVRNNEVWITGPQNYSGALVLPEEIDGMPVVGVAARAFSENTGITSLTLPESLRYIEADAFYNCRGLREPVLIPDEMEWIWPDALYGTAVTGKKYTAADRYARLSQSQRFIQTGILPNCRGAWENGMFFWIRDGEAELVRLPADVDSTLYLPEEVEGAPLTSIGAFSFMAREYTRPITCIIDHVILPDSVKTLGAYAFYSTQIKTIFLPEGVEELQDYSLCTDSETVITLPSSLQRFGAHDFFSCRGGYNRETVYAYPGTAAYEKALEEECSVISRKDADGRIRGNYAGLRFVAGDGAITITSASRWAFRDIPAEIDGLPVTTLHFKGFDSYQPVTIPPTVTSIVDEQHNMRNNTYYVWPGSYAERFCREMGYTYKNALTVMGIPFADVEDTLWYHEAVCYVYNTGLMSGVSDTRFAPEDTTSRAMLVTVLWRLAGCPEAQTANTFEDVVPGSWYGEAVRWAASQSIVQGISATRFAPNDPVTREQIATILLRYAKRYGLDDGARSNVAPFPDAASISSWALEGIQWAKASGILTGQLKGTEVYLNPLAGAKRSEIATMLMRFCVE